MTKDLNKLSATEALKLLKAKHVSPPELLASHITAVEKTSGLNAYITKTFEYAESQAAASESRYLNGEAGALDGLPIAVKDIFCTENIRTTVGSKILENFVPTYESTITSKLFTDGCVMLGKTNMDEFAMGSSTAYSAFGKCINPWKKNNSNEDLAPGGSSGGSAATVSSFGALAALGTDTGGSIRQPAAFCGLFGLKPSYGRCSRYGIVSLASSLDQAGVFTRTLEDAALFTEHMMGYDAKDPTSAKLEAPNLQEGMLKNIKGLRVGIPREYSSGMLSAEMKSLLEEGIKGLEQEGAIIKEVSLPHSKYGVASYYIILPAEASSNFARYDGVRYGLRVEAGKTIDDMYRETRAQGFGPEVQRRIMIGTYVLSSGAYDEYFSRAQKVRRLMITDFQDAFNEVDVLLTPTTTGSAFALNDKAQMDPIAMYLNDVFTIPVNLAGLPAMSVPCKLDASGLPIGLQLIGNRFDELTVFRAAHALNQSFNFNSCPAGY